jgi:HEAT repeat protein
MATRRKSPMTLAQHHAQLKAEGKWDEYIARKKERDDAIRRRTEENSKAELPLIRDLRDAGATISSVWDLVNSKAPYPQLLPILFAHLDRPYPERVREGIARALATRESRSLWDKLVSRYLTESDSNTNGLKWALHLAISAAADVTVLDTLIRLACDRRHGRNRALFIDALDRINDPRAEATLEELADDPDLADDVQRVTKRRSKRR